MGIGRVNMPSILVTGGVMDAGPNLLTLEQIGIYSAQCARGEITEQQLTWYKQHACPSCGACSFMGTASTMQVMGESLGLMLPGSALMPATCEDLRAVAKKAGQQVMKLAQLGLRPRDIVTMDSFENAIMVHAAISGSTNSLLHIPAIAHEFGLNWTQNCSTGCTVVLTTYWIFVRPESGLRSSSTMPAVSPVSWRKSVLSCIWTA